MKFFAIRYFVVKASLTLFPLGGDREPKDLFIEPLIDEAQEKYYGRNYTVRFLNEKLSDRYLAGYFLKSIDTHLIELDEELFSEQNIKNWEKLFFLIDTERQLILFEHQNQIATPKNIKNALLKLTNKNALHNGYEVKLDFLVDKFAFWNIINDSQGLYQIAFNLNAPNLFGGSKKANEWLKELKDKHNMTKIGVDFRNENAELGYDKDELESYRDYADSGGGEWTLGVIEEHRKKRYKSANHLRRKEKDVDLKNPKNVKRHLVTIIAELQEVLNNLDDLEDE